MSSKPGLARLAPLAPPAAVIPLRPAPSSPASDAALVARGREGDRLALQVLYRRHAPAILERATRLLARSVEAEDVVQDSFVAAFRDLAQLSNPALFRAWVMGIAVHQVQRRFRRRRLLARLGLDRGCDDARLAQRADPGLGPEQRCALEELDRGLSLLSSELRLAWMLRHVEGCELSEVAAQCSCSLATAKRRLGRAEGQLGRWLSDSAAHEALDGRKR